MGSDEGCNVSFSSRYTTTRVHNNTGFYALAFRDEVLQEPTQNVKPVTFSAWLNPHAIG
jgi:hypothetical protein